MSTLWGGFYALGSGAHVPKEDECHWVPLESERAGNLGAPFLEVVGIEAKIGLFLGGLVLRVRSKERNV